MSLAHTSVVAGSHRRFAPQRIRLICLCLYTSSVQPAKPCLIPRQSLGDYQSNSTIFAMYLPLSVMTTLSVWRSSLRLVWSYQQKKVHSCIGRPKMSNWKNSKFLFLLKFCLRNGTYRKMCYMPKPAKCSRDPRTDGGCLQAPPGGSVLIPDQYSFPVPRVGAPMISNLPERIRLAELHCPLQGAHYREKSGKTGNFVNKNQGIWRNG